MAAGDDLWVRFSADPRIEASSSLRASDADRDVVHDVLREAFAVGQIDLDELDERTTQVIGSRTLGDLLPIVRDVVPSASAPARRPTGAADVRAAAIERYRRDLRDARNGWILVSGICVAIWAATSAFSTDLLPFWPIFPMLGIGIGWLSVRMGAEGRIEEHEKKIAEQRRRDSTED